MDIWSLSLILDAARSASSEVPWYNATLLAAVVTAVATFVIGQFSARQNRSRAESDRKQAEEDRRVALLWAFYAEAMVIRKQLRPLAQAIADTDPDKPLTLSKLTTKRTPPMLVYRENVKHLGEIGDGSLVQYIVSLYSRLEDTAEGERELGEARDSDPNEFERLLLNQRMDQVIAFATAVYVTRYVSELLDDPAHAKIPSMAFEDDRRWYEDDEKVIEKAQDLLGSQLSGSRANRELPSDGGQRSG
jgi:hypothetical protein